MTECNYCKWKKYKAEAKAEGKILVNVDSNITDNRATFHGKDIHKVKSKSEKLTKKNWVCWMWEIPKRCAC